MRGIFPVRTHSAELYGGKVPHEIEQTSDQPMGEHEDTQLQASIMDLLLWVLFNSGKRRC